MFVNAHANLSPEAFQAFAQSLENASHTKDGYEISYRILEANHFAVPIAEDFLDAGIEMPLQRHIAQLKVAEDLTHNSTHELVSREFTFQLVPIESDQNDILVSVFDPPLKSSLCDIAIEDPHHLERLLDSRITSRIENIHAEQYLQNHPTLYKLYDTAVGGAQFLDHLLLRYNRELGTIHASPASIREVLEKFFKDFNNAYLQAKSSDDYPLKSEAIEMLGAYIQNLELFTSKRPVQLLCHRLPFLANQIRRLSALLIADVVPHEDTDTSDAFQVQSKAWGLELMDDYRLGRFSAVPQSLKHIVKDAEVNKELVLSILQSDPLRREPLYGLCRLGEQFTSESYVVFSEYAALLVESIKNHDQDSPHINDSNLLRAIEVYAELLDSYQTWWRINSRFDLLKTESKGLASMLDLQFPKSVIRHESLLPYEIFHAEGLNVPKFIETVLEITDLVEARNRAFGLVSPIKIASFSKSSIKPYPGMYDEISEIEERNRWTPDLPFGLSHPTGEKWIHSLVEDHDATIFTASKETLGAHCIAATNQETMPEVYQERILEAKQLGMIPPEAFGVFVEVIVVDGTIRPQFKEEKRRGFVEIFGKLSREIAGKLWTDHFSEKQSEREIIKPIYLVAMVGTENLAAELYEQDGWIVNRDEAAIMYEHDSPYFRMTKRII